MKNRDYIEGFIEGISMCWNNGMKVFPEYTAIYIDTFFIDNDKNNDLNEIIKKKLLQYYESSSSEKKDDNIRKKLEKLNIVFKKNRKYEKLIKQNETAWQYAIEHELIYNGKELTEPPKKTEEDVKKEKLDSLDAEYTRKIKDIEAEIVRTLAIGDDDLLSELKEEREQLVNEYKEKRGAI